MNDKFSPTPLVKLLQIILNQYNKQKCIFGITREIFFMPLSANPFKMQRFEHLLETPIGVAAGPHTQLAQNIVSAWLCGARYIELKTIQTLDELEISKPCIDMQDEGYNCEWSQELKIQQSFDQYLDAWIIIHVLKHLLEGSIFTEPGLIFNMSVGYNLEGIKNENVQWFLEKMQNASAEIEQRVELLKVVYPQITDISINPCISNNITLSTMHGCPSGEIEEIGQYLLEEKKLHTVLKLNPTLLGKEHINSIIKQSGYEAIIPDSAFEHDLKYSEATKIIKNLTKIAEFQELQFGIKLSNTLECLNNKDIFPQKEKMMYLSGNPLHPIAISLAERLQNDFNGALNLSFSAGVNAFNIGDVLSCGLSPVTVCSDLLKPGGYGRLNQYLENLWYSFNKVGAVSIDEFICKKDIKNTHNPLESAHRNLKKYATKVKQDKDYSKKNIKTQSLKTNKQLGIFDCIHAPCESTCPTHQGIPDYMYYTAKNKFDEAKRIILQTNPFPKITGMVCDHTCQSKCTRINYDSPLLIKDIKHFIAENSDFQLTQKDSIRLNNHKVAIIGAGPSGLSCAYFLTLSGFSVTIYEKNSKPGGMASNAIPKFRLDNQSVELDIEKIVSLGVQVFYNHTIDKKEFSKILQEYNFIYISVGAQDTRKFPIEGSDNSSVLNPLTFLFGAKNGNVECFGKKIVVIGGGNTAIDAARTAKRLIPKDGSVSLVYRRTIKQMPANEEEIKALIDEKIEILELVNPLKINQKEGKIISITCQKMKLGEKDKSGRATSLPIIGSEFEIECDTVIPAVGQDIALDFIEPEKIKNIAGYETKISNVFIGGDALNGGISIIAAIGDGRKVAQLIIEKSGIQYNTKPKSNRPKADYRNLMIRKTKRIKVHNINKSDIEQDNSFELIKSSLSPEEAIFEASRCLLCDELCNICTTVCPNLALFAYQTNNFKIDDPEGRKIFEIKQNTQILHISDWCNQCGNCNTFCPTSGAPFEQKPHLYLNKSAFNQANEGYYFIYTELEQTLLYKNGSEIHSFAENPINFSYITTAFSSKIKKQTFNIQDITYRNPDIKIELSKAIEMSIILDGVMQFFGLSKIENIL
jgi:putative selenate reductase